HRVDPPPLIPAQAGIQGPLAPSPASVALVPRFRGEERTQNTEFHPIQTRSSRNSGTVAQASPRFQKSERRGCNISHSAPASSNWIAVGAASSVRSLSPPELGFTRVRSFRLAEVG